MKRINGSLNNPRIPESPLLRFCFCSFVPDSPFRLFRPYFLRFSLTPASPFPRFCLCSFVPVSPTRRFAVSVHTFSDSAPRPLGAHPDSVPRPLGALPASPFLIFSDSVLRLLVNSHHGLGSPPSIKSTADMNTSITQ